MKIEKACPVVLRHSLNTNHQLLEILAFKHPLAGFQLVKGTIEQGELPAQAAVRELFEEAGIKACVNGHLGNQEIEATGQIWHFYQCVVSNELPDQWQFYTQDDNGHLFEFFWYPLVMNSHPANHDWHPMFQQALLFLQQRLSLIFANK